MDFIILNWWYDEKISQAVVVTDEDGINLVFKSFDDAEKYAESELNGRYKVVSQ